MAKSAKVLRVSDAPPPDRPSSHGQEPRRESHPITNFLLALSSSIKMRKRYRDPDQRRRLLEEWNLEDDPLFQPGATEDAFRTRVDAEGGPGLAEVEWIIRWAIDPDANPDDDPNPDDGPNPDYDPNA